MSSKKIVVNFCPTGMVPTKKMTPHVPIWVDEIIEQTHEANELGITIVHLHARDENGDPTWKASVYRDIFDGIRKYCPDLIICASTSGRLHSEFEKRSEVIELQPDMCSLTLSSLNFPKQASINSPDMIQKLAQKMNKYGVHPELECFELGMINYGQYLIKKSFIKEPYYWNLIFGNVAGFQADFSQMGIAVQCIPDDHFVALSGIGLAQLPVTASAIAMGYGIRIGLEDNIWFDSGKKQLATNIDLLSRSHELMKIHEKEVMSGKELGEYGFYNENR